MTSPLVSTFAFRLQEDLELASQGLLDMGLVKAFADINESATGKSHERIVNLLQKNNLPKLEMEKMICQSGTVQEDALFLFLSEARHRQRHYI